MKINTITIPAIEVFHPVSNEVLFATVKQTISELDLVILDDTKRKVVSVNLGLKLRARPLILWKDAAYDTAGDYTQAQVEAKVLELLGEDPIKVITDLIKPPATPAKKK